MTTKPRILLLGVGNVLCTEEGVGVHAANHLAENYTFSDNVTVMEGGTLGKLLMPSLSECELVIIMDAVLGGDKPGSVYRLENDGLRKSIGFNDSQHQVDLIDTLIHCDLIGNRPDAVVIGMEPEDWQSISMELTPTVQAQFDRFISHVLNELHARGGTAVRKGVDAV